MPKKPAPKKKTAGTKAKKSPKKKNDPQKNSLIKQLNSIIEVLDEKGLIFLIRQAQILQYNMNIDIHNEATQKTAKPETAAADRPGMTKYSMEIVEGKDNSHFILVLNGHRNFFALDEMKKIVQICHASTNAEDASIRLYGWFSNNRKDVINNTKISNQRDPALNTIYTEIIKKYTIKD